MNTTTYKLLLLCHIASVLVAFAPAAVHPLLGRQFSEAGPEMAQRFAGFAARNSRRVYAPALLLAGFFGVMLVVTSDDAWDFEQSWINAALTIWIIMNGLVHGLVLRGEKKMAVGDTAGEKLVQIGGTLLSLGFVVMLYVMIWKPGL